MPDGGLLNDVRVYQDPEKAETTCHLQKIISLLALTTVNC